MKNYTFPAVFIFILGLAFSNTGNAQIVINPGPAVTPEDMVEFLMGPGVSYENVSFLGYDQSSGIFTNGNTTNLNLNEGVFLTSGLGTTIPGPNSSSSAGSNNGFPGHVLLDGLTSAYTYDAAVLEFDFIPLNDTIKCHYVFGSEEYNEWVGSSFNDVFGFFVTGPDPAGGDYDEMNVAIVPGTANTIVAINNVNNGYATMGVVPTGPCTNCEFYLDNTSGTTLEYDGFTAVLPVQILVVPGETYHFVFAVSDCGDGIFDTGVFIEGTSFKSPGPADFFAFDFLAANNPGLDYDVIGTIENKAVYLEVPEGTDVTNLVATYEEHGADVFVNGTRQENGITPNDFTEELTYHLEGYETADWYVHVDVISDLPVYLFQSVTVGPNPSNGSIRIDNASGINISLLNSIGVMIHQYADVNGSLNIPDLPSGIYFVQFERDGVSETRKIIVR